ncbi:MAG: hypothetical protein BAJATHORv1_40014 [Candidatus Thorarchaeota archaeon]|nr:MAG: hypothetical protein BAJATHORv1_40014 [Candidatus Thorarchaeota archaeon]
MGTARLILSAIGGGFKMMAKTYLAIRRGKGQVKDGAKEFYNKLQEYGVPKEVAREITSTYTKSGMDILSIRKMMQLASKFDDEEKVPLFHH